MLILLVDEYLKSLLHNLLHGNRAGDHRSRLNLAFIAHESR